MSDAVVFSMMRPMWVYSLPSELGLNEALSNTNFEVPGVSADFFVNRLGKTSYYCLYQLSNLGLPARQEEECPMQCIFYRLEIAP